MKIFFDLDGTLIDVEPRHYLVYRQVVLEFNGVPLERKNYWDLKRKKAKWPELLLKSSLPDALEAKFLNIFITKIEAMEFLEQDKLFSGVTDRINHLLEDGHTLYLVSLRRNAENLDKQLKHLGIYDYFTYVLSGHSDTDGYDKKIELIRGLVDEKGGVIVGDTEADIITGQSVGLITVAMSTGIRDKSFLANLNPDYLLGNIGELQKVTEITGYKDAEQL